MPRVRRKLTPFSLSFLDIMSCGFGAVVLLFLIIKHNVDAKIPEQATPDLRSEVTLLEEEILEGKKNLVKIRNTISDIDQELVEAQGMARRIMDEIKATEGLTDEMIENPNAGKLEKLKAQIRQLEIEKAQLKQELDKTGEDSRRFAGDGDRAYVTGLKMGGRHILVLLDISSSMLDKSIVNILRRRNMRDERKRTAPKWVRALKTVDWLSAKFSIDSHYQIYTFNTITTSVLPGTKGEWLDVRNRDQLNAAIANLDHIVPENGTNLERAFIAAAELNPRPDNIYLITDSLPTQGAGTPKNGTISGKQRLQIFHDAVKKLPNGTPVNVILSPMEGDPEAADAFWQLSQNTRGSFMSPAEDWP